MHTILSAGMNEYATYLDRAMHSYPRVSSNHTVTALVWACTHCVALSTAKLAGTHLLGSSRPHSTVSGLLEQGVDNHSGLCTYSFSTYYEISWLSFGDRLLWQILSLESLEHDALCFVLLLLV